MLGVRGAIPDVDGALAKAVFEHMTDKMKPAKDEAWDSREHRGADAFVELCRSYADVHPSVRSKRVAVLHINTDGTGEVDGVPVAATTVASVVDEARTHTQDHGAAPRDHGNTRTIPTALRREIEHRDRHCRYPGCTRTFGLEIHHITLVAWGSHTTRSQLVMLCPIHHPRMEPHGTGRLTGNAVRPDGLELIEVSRRTRAGPGP